MDASPRILLIRPSALGDVARSVCVLAALRTGFPRAHIDWLVQDGFGDVIRQHPALSGVVAFPRREFSRWFTSLRWGELRRYLRALREARYDMVIDAQGLARSAVLTWATKARERVGHAGAREGAWLAYTRRVSDDIETHSVDRMLALTTALGCPAIPSPEAMRLHTPVEAREYVRMHPRLAMPAASHADTAAAPNIVRYAVLAPTSRWIAKQWPDDRFAALARALADRGVHVALVGSASERQQVPACLDAARTHPRIIDFLGVTSVAQLMCLMEHASLVVANDSAALHIAVGFGRPLVGLYGPTRVNRVGPYGRERDVIQHLRPGDTMNHKDPGGRALMERISFDEVLHASIERIKA